MRSDGQYRVDSGYGGDDYGGGLRTLQGRVNGRSAYSAAEDRAIVLF